MAAVSALAIGVSIVVAGPASGSSAAAPAPSGVDCVAAHSDHSSARVRPDAHGTERNELSADRAAAIERELAGKRVSTARAARAVTVPVVFHVVYGSDGTGNVSRADIRAQIAEMNQDFAGREAPGVAANTRFSFELKLIKRWQNDAWFNDPDSAAGERAMKRATHVGDAGVLNIWSTNTSYLGYATFPTDYEAHPNLDGIVIQWGSLPGGPIANYNEGKTATHEAGHWLGLYHTFQGGCTRKNDEVADTPAQQSPTTGCPQGRDSCPDRPGLDPIHNYMDYSYDACYNQFTPGQASRMQDFYAIYRT